MLLKRKFEIAGVTAALVPPRIWSPRRGFGPPADLVPLGPYPLAALVPLNEILTDLVPPTKTLHNLSFFRKMLCKHLINIFAKLCYQS